MNSLKVNLIMLPLLAVLFCIAGLYTGAISWMVLALLAALSTCYTADQELKRQRRVAYARAQYRKAVTRQ